MENILIDTNVIVRYLKSGDGILADILGHYKLFISSLTLTELLASERTANDNAQKQVLDFVDKNFKIVNVDEEIGQKAGRVLRETDGITLIHAEIAATSIVKEMPLLTYQVKTFDQIPDLKLIDIPA